MRRLLLALAVLVLVGSVVDKAEARRRWRCRGGTCSVSVSTWKKGIRKDDQAACQREADYMAKHHIYAHVFGQIGRFEGWGAGSKGCATCVPGWNATLTGDASATSSSSGVVFRVRSWR